MKKLTINDEASRKSFSFNLINGESNEAHVGDTLVWWLWDSDAPVVLVDYGCVGNPQRVRVSEKETSYSVTV